MKYEEHLYEARGGTTVGAYHMAIIYVLLFISERIECAMGHRDDLPMTKGHTT